MSLTTAVRRFLNPGLRRPPIRADFEDRITAEFAREAGTEATPQLRTHAIQLVGIVRLATSPEARAAITGLTPVEATARVEPTLRPLSPGRFP